jgi:hypothetical protein
MRRNDENGVLERAGNAVLPPILLHTYEEGQYSSGEELVEDLDSAWNDYREEWDLDAGEFEQEFRVSQSGGWLRDEEVVVDSEDHRYVFSENSGSLTDRFLGEETSDGWMAESYTTEHFNGSEGPYKGHFMDLFVKQNFQLGESYISGSGAGN